MKYTRKLRVRLTASVLFAGLLAVACTSTQTGDLRVDYPAEQAQVEQRLQEVLVAAENKDFDRLDSYHFYGPKFTKFVGSSPGRQDAAAARKGEHDGLSAIKDLKMRPHDLQIDVFGKVAIATFILENSYERGGAVSSGKERSTLVFVKDGREWKIAHEHFSPIKP